MALVQVEWFGTGTRYDLENLHQCGKKVKTKSQKVFGANSYISRSYRRKSGRRDLFATPILNKVKLQTMAKLEVGRGLDRVGTKNGLA